jgi:hypothetical protein
MFNQNGLSLDQAPPLSVVFRFFFVGALFGIISGISLFIYGTEVFDATSTAAVTFTHLLTLGVMLSFMFAALFQMLPIIAGVTLSSPIQKANVLLYPFVLGTVTLLFAFNMPHAPWLFIAASVLLSVSLMSILFVMLKHLLQLQHHTASSKAITYALFSLMFVLLFALYLTLSLGGISEGAYYLPLKEAHYSFGLYGWVSLLIIAISFQVIEMFYVTPAYPDLISKHLPKVLFSLLLISSALALFLPHVWFISDIFLILLLSTYALITLKRLTQRKRPLTDATVWFWRMGLISLLLSLLSMAITLFTTLEIFKPLSYIFFASFALSIVFAMFYKIVPFLTWFHLNSQGYFTAPMMHEVIHPKTAKKHLYIHLVTIFSFLVSLFIAQVIFVAGAFTLVSFGWMAYQIIYAQSLYKKTQVTGEKFDMGNFS